MTLRMRVLPRFPATITATNGLKVTRPTGTPNLIVEPDFGSLVQIPSVDDPDNVFFWAWDRNLSLYRSMSFADLFAGVADLGFMEESVYDPQNIHDDAFDRANHTGVQAISTITGLQTALDAKTTALLAATRQLAQGRLTLSTGTPVPTADVTAATTLYFTPYGGNQIGLYVSGAWTVSNFAEASLALTGLTAGKPYDIFGYDNAGALAIEALVWTNDTTRATNLALQDGVRVKSGDATRRYLGTIYTSATGQCEDSAAKRYVWNMYNRVRRTLLLLDTTDSWTYTTAAFRQARGVTSNQLDFIRGLDDEAVEATAISIASNSSAVILRTGIGLDSSTVNAGLVGAAVSSATALSLCAQYRGLPGLGRHTLRWLELSGASGTTTWYGDGGGSDGSSQAGMAGSVVG